MSASATIQAPPVPVTWDRPRYDVVLLGAVLALVAFGIVMVYSSSAVFAGAKLHDGFYFLKRQIIFAIIGTVGMHAMVRMGYERLKGAAYPLLLISGLLVVATLIPGIGARVNGAQRWIRVPGFQIQPTEFLKVALCVYLAKSVSEKDGEALRDFRIGLLPHFVVLGVLAAFVIAQPDFGTVMVMAAVTMVVLFVAGARLTYVFVAMGALIPVAYLLITHSEYRMRRIQAFIPALAAKAAGTGVGWAGAGAGVGHGAVRIRSRIRVVESRDMVRGIRVLHR
jgi:cell division protein FtsW